MSEASTITLLNKSSRHFDLGYEQLIGEDGTPQFQADGKTPIPDTTKPRKYAPNGTITLPLKDGLKLAKMYPKELVDLSKLPGAIDVGALKADAAKLKAENDDLKRQLAALPKVEAASAPVAEEAAPAQAQPQQGQGRRR